MWPITKFWGSNHITATAVPKVVKFCRQVGYINSSNRMTSPTEGAWLWSRDCLKNFPLVVMQCVTRVCQRQLSYLWTYLTTEDGINYRTETCQPEGTPLHAANFVNFSSETADNGWRVFAHPINFYIGRQANVGNCYVVARAYSLEQQNAGRAHAGLCRASTWLQYTVCIVQLIDKLYMTVCDCSSLFTDAR